MRIWHQGFIEMETVPAYREALARHLRLVSRPDTEVVIHGLHPGSYTPHSSPAEQARYAYLTALHTEQILDNVRRAEREGYDAVAIAILQNPGLRLARTLADVPVAGYGEAAMHLACMLGSRFGIVAFNDDLFPLLEAEAREAGLGARLGPIVSMACGYEEVAAGFERPGPVLEAFHAAARRALRDGADVLIPGQTIMAEVLFQSGVSRVDEAPVIDAVGAVVKVAELLAELRAQSGLYVSRRGYFHARPPEPLVEAARRAYGLDRAPLLARPPDEGG